MPVPILDVPFGAKEAGRPPRIAFRAPTLHYPCLGLGSGLGETMRGGGDISMLRDLGTIIQPATSKGLLISIAPGVNVGCHLVVAAAVDS